jgi:hypothetical protein
MALVSSTCNYFGMNMSKQLLSIALPLPNEGDYSVVRFRPGRPKCDLQRERRNESDGCEIIFLLAERFGKYEQARENDNWRGMTENGLAFVMIIALITIGLWLVPSFLGK